MWTQLFSELFLTSDFCDTLGSSIERALGRLRLFVGRGDASKAEDQQCAGEAHDEVDAVDADKTRMVINFICLTFNISLINGSSDKKNVQKSSTREP